MFTETLTVSPTLNFGVVSLTEPAAIAFNASIIIPPVFSDIRTFLVQRNVCFKITVLPPSEPRHRYDGFKCLYILPQKKINCKTFFRLSQIILLFYRAFQDNF